MSFYSELDIEFKKNGMNVKRTKVPRERCATPEENLEFRNRLNYKIKENNDMQYRSMYCS